jgi:hypothetical protein
LNSLEFNTERSTTIQKSHNHFISEISSNHSISFQISITSFFNLSIALSNCLTTSFSSSKDLFIQSFEKSSLA